MNAWLSEGVSEALIVPCTMIQYHIQKLCNLHHIQHSKQHSTRTMSCNESPWLADPRRTLLFNNMLVQVLNFMIDKGLCLESMLSHKTFRMETGICGACCTFVLIAIKMEGHLVLRVYEENSCFHTLHTTWSSMNTQHPSNSSTIRSASGPVTLSRPLFITL